MFLFLIYDNADKHEKDNGAGRLAEANLQLQIFGYAFKYIYIS